MDIISVVNLVEKRLDAIVHKQRNKCLCEINLFPSETQLRMLTIVPSHILTDS